MGYVEEEYKKAKGAVENPILNPGVIGGRLVQGATGLSYEDQLKIGAAGGAAAYGYGAYGAGGGAGAAGGAGGMSSGSGLMYGALGSSLLGGYLQGEAAKEAAKTQAAAGREAIAGQERMLASQQAIEQPYAAGGLQALNRLLAGTAPGGEFTKQFAMKDLPTATPYVAKESEAQKFATKEALAAMQSQMAVGGQGLSSNAIAGAGQLAGDIGSKYEQQGYNQWLASSQMDFNQALAAQQQAQNVFQMNLQNQMRPLEYLTGVGQAAASGQAANVGAAGANIAGLTTGIGNVQAAGQIGQANALAGTVGNVGQYLMMQNLLGQSAAPVTQQQQMINEQNAGL